MTSLLLDTHVLVWWALASPRIRGEWVEALVDPENAVFVSVTSIWEIEIKKRSGKLDFGHDTIDLAREYDFELLPIGARDARLASSLDWDHRDPFDRMLVAQALEHGLTIVTGDDAVRAAPGIRAL